MKVFSVNTGVSLALVLGLCACRFPTPPPTDCNPDPYSYPPSMRCYTTTYSADGEGQFTTKDIVTATALTEEQALKLQARHFAEKFELAEDQGMKIARSVHDLASLRERTDNDLRDFAVRLYGISPARILSASGKAQAGDVSELNALVAESAASFGTTPGNMKRIIKSLHGDLLREQGIAF